MTLTSISMKLEDDLKIFVVRLPPPFITELEYCSFFNHDVTTRIFYRWHTRYSKNKNIDTWLLDTVHRFLLVIIVCSFVLLIGLSSSSCLLIPGGIGGTVAVVSGVAGSTSSDSASAASLAAASGPALHTGISLEQLKANDFKKSCWISIQGKVLDVTDWMKQHPGGKDKFECGQDMTAKFEAQHGKDLTAQLAKADTL